MKDNFFKALSRKSKRLSGLTPEEVKREFPKAVEYLKETGHRVWVVVERGTPGAGKVEDLLDAIQAVTVSPGVATEWLGEARNVREL